ncbi:hypothetical protein [Streptomyces resistomycificus]|uniref:Ketohydroxyglutarate aldolase n=1 Tax=Streptomyces resistomycificus TaxID=67356 RepID=A0A0L8LXB3_9ACTN|nr:hypothetical protein [Streptomyces resistomycificus]KOG42822.1 hypothetical protein ADK37_04045 [Streptomyces resistomycificus]KUN90745.1 hypothetical protein AQJ84_38850 [Streptomyces resistomycificus]
MKGTSGPTPVGVVVAVDPDRFTEAVEGLRRAGLTVTSEQRVLGTLSGTVAEDRIGALDAVDGVNFVDRERTARLPRPDSPIQ